MVISFQHKILSERKGNLQNLGTYLFYISVHIGTVLFKSMKANCVFLAELTESLCPPVCPIIKEHIAKLMNLGHTVAN